LPEETSFLANTATESFKITADRVSEFISVFLEDLQAPQLLEEVNGKKRVLDITHTPSEVAGVEFHNDRRPSQESQQRGDGQGDRHLLRDDAVC
jgi:hypothetical protein